MANKLNFYILHNKNVSIFKRAVTELKKIKLLIGIFVITQYNTFN